MKAKFLPQTLIAAAMMLFVWSCATDPNIESARLAFVQQDFEEVIRSAESAIENDPENADGYYYIGLAHAAKAEEFPPEERKQYYETARENLIKARQLYEEQTITGGEADNLDNIIVESWGYEHNEGVQPLTDDIISSAEDSLELARHHFNNAIAINPDSVQTFNLLAEVNFALGDLEAAEEITRKIIYDMEKGDLFNYYRLAFYHMERGRDEEAVAVLEEAREIFPDEIEVIQEIANAYLRIGETDKALEVVEELMERDPENPQYRLVYATQVYQMVQEIDDQIRKLHDDIYDMSREVREKAREPGVTEEDLQPMLDEMDQKSEEAEELIQESFRFADKAEEQLLIAKDSDPDNPDIHSTLGIVYQNKAAVMQDKRNMTDDMDEADRLDKEAREYLERALPHYEKAAELEPDNIEHWRSLFRIYTNLGMDEKAEEAQEKAGF